MRTTLSIDKDALLVIRGYAAERQISLGEAVSDLVHLGAENRPRFKKKNGWVIVEPTAGTPPLTNELLDKWEQEDNGEEYQRAVSARR